jgi:hypothetical protein
VTLNYRFDSEDAPPLRLRLRVEINSREHFTAFGLKTIPFAVDSRWFQGSAKIVTYELEELLGTKLRALYQRKRGATCLTWQRLLKRRRWIRLASSKPSAPI